MCPGGVPTGYTYFIPQEEMLESRVLTRGYMESRMVVSLAGRCAIRSGLRDRVLGLGVGSVVHAQAVLAQAQQQGVLRRPALILPGVRRSSGPLLLRDDLRPCGERAETPAHREQSLSLSSCAV